MRALLFLARIKVLSFVKLESKNLYYDSSRNFNLTANYICTFKFNKDSSFSILHFKILNLN